MDDLSSVPKGNVDLKFDLHPLMLVLVSLGSHKSLSKLELRVSNTWLGYALEPVKSIVSKNITHITLYSWLGEEEEPSNDIWKDSDVILNTDVFKPLMQVDVAYVYRGSDLGWYYTKNFERSKFPTLLPNVSKRGILRY